jgi:hypothetical protein
VTDAAPPGFDARIVEFAEALRSKASRSGRRSFSTPSPRSEPSAGRRRDRSRGALGDARQVARRSPRLRAGRSSASSSAPPKPQAVREGIKEGGGSDRPYDEMTGGRQLDLENLREQVLQAIREGNESAMRDLARLALAAFGRREDGSGVVGVDVQRIRRALGLRAEPGGPRQPDPQAPRADAPPGLTREQIRRFEQHLRRELERAQIERTEALPPGAASSTSSTAPCPRRRSRTWPPCIAWWRS